MCPSMKQIFGLDVPSPPPAPAPTPAQKKNEETQAQILEKQDQMIEEQQAQADIQKSEEKKKRAISARSVGSSLYGIRSLISGPAGGSGFLSKKAS